MSKFIRLQPSQPQPNKKEGRKTEEFLRFVLDLCLDDRLLAVLIGENGNSASQPLGGLGQSGIIAVAVKGQKFFLKGGVIDEPKYEYRGPETMPFDELIKRGYKLPFYADLSRMPEMERKVIWGMMVGEEGKTKIPILQYYTERGFDPEKHMLQSYGNGWQSAIHISTKTDGL